MNMYYTGDRNVLTHVPTHTPTSPRVSLPIRVSQLFTRLDKIDSSELATLMREHNRSIWTLKPNDAEKFVMVRIIMGIYGIEVELVDGAVNRKS